jgi:hypothetical protein
MRPTLSGLAVASALRACKLKDVRLLDAAFESKVA